MNMKCEIFYQYTMKIMKGLNLSPHIILICFVTIVIVYVLYYFVTINRQIEVYKYTVNDLHKNSHTTELQKNSTYTNHIYADLYNSDGTNGGFVSSVNQHIIKNNINHVNTLTTYKTKYGTVTFNIYYETVPNTHYLYGKVTDVISENETGDYAGKKVKIHIEGKDNGDRIVTITSENRFLIN